VQQRRRIGDLLIEEGRITQQQLDLALDEQKRTGELLGAILFSHGFISQQDLTKVLSLSMEERARVPTVDSDAVDIPDELESLVKQSVLSLQAGGERGHGDSTKHPLVRLVDKIIMAGITRHATDIHIGPDTKGTRIRFRVDGSLQHGSCLPKELLNPMVSRLKILGAMNIAESRMPQDGGAEFFHNDRRLDLRISTFPLVNGENVVVRILDKARLKLGLDNLGFCEQDARRVYESLKLPYGMILVTGPTGSGKTTTLYSCLSYINTVSRNIFTIEDPVEYQVPLVRQAQVNVKAGLTFATGLRSILRQDPDIILIGEMRDFETAELAVRSALTGHLVFSTLHTNDAISSIHRLMDMGIEPFLISSTLDTIIAQRLVRLLCSSCKTPVPATDALYAELRVVPSVRPIYRANGCERCGNSGYIGRTTIYELLKLTPALRALINRKANQDELRNEALKQGFRAMFDIGADKIRLGLTSIEEVSSVTRTGV
jgi:type IV pilus assembly protein PilB